ncbi:hypothetical protein ACNTMW_21785 [Planosporangium sp. 12N6]|uniref:phosphatase domain-containing protein n=1 Tax=Planosporangium spinosum TaxID=3402278 RepID=UPI003CEF849E
MTEARPLAVFDVDGVVADVRHRLHHVARRPKNWRRFFAGAASDPPLAPGVELAREYARDHRVVWLTGRPEYLRRVTERWLSRHDLPVDELLMRPTSDHRPAREYKAERLRRLGGTGEVAIVVDDDPAVVETLSQAGWPVRLADWVPYAASLGQAQEREGRT